MALVLAVKFGCAGDQTHRLVAEGGAIPSGQVSRLRDTSAVFYLGTKSNFDQAAFEQSISEAWQTTPIVAVPYSERRKYIESARTSYFVIEAVDTSRARSSGLAPIHLTRFYLSLVVPNGKEQEDTPRLCAIELSPDFKTVQMAQKRENSDKVIEEFYDKGRFRNWTPAMLGVYLRALEKNLDAGHCQGLFRDARIPPKLAQLKQYPLYIPQHVFLAWGLSRGLETWLDSKHLLKSYSHPYEVVSESRLRELLRDSSKPVYILDSIRSGASTVLSVFQNNGDLVYRHYSTIGGVLRESDLATLGSAVTQSSQDMNALERPDP